MVNKVEINFINEAERQGYGRFPLRKIFLFMETLVSLYADEFDDFGEFNITSLAAELECEFPESAETANDCYTYADELAVAFDLTYK